MSGEEGTIAKHKVFSHAQQLPPSSGRSSSLQCSGGRMQNIQSTSTMHIVLLIFAYTKTHDGELEVESEPERPVENRDPKAETSCLQPMHKSQIDKKLHVCACFLIPIPFVS